MCSETSDKRLKMIRHRERRGVAWKANSQFWACVFVFIGKSRYLFFFLRETKSRWKLKRKFFTAHPATLRSSFTSSWCRTKMFQIHLHHDNWHVGKESFSTPPESVNTSEYCLALFRLFRRSHSSRVCTFSIERINFQRFSFLLFASHSNRFNLHPKSSVRLFSFPRAHHWINNESAAEWKAVTAQLRRSTKYENKL